MITGLERGGAEAWLVDLLTHLPKDQYEHHVVYFHNGPHVESITRLNIPLYQIKGVACLYDPVFCIRLLLCVRSIAPTIIQASLWSATVLGRLLGKILHIPVVMVLHAESTISSDRSTYRLRRFIDRCLSSHASVVVAVSQAVAHQFRVDNPRVAVDKVRVLNGIDIDSVIARGSHAQQTRETLGWTAHNFVIGTVGRFVWAKNQKILVESFALLHRIYPECRLLLIGHGPLENDLRLQVQRLQLESVVQFVIGRDAAGYYPLLDCFVLPSVSEGLSLALLEALCWGVASVVSGQAGCREIIEHGTNGLLVNPNDAYEIAQAIESFIQDRDRRKLFSTLGQQLMADRFSISLMVDGYSAIFNQLARDWREGKTIREKG